jgi:DNA mismatch endonuclease, patch repair protein
MLATKQRDTLPEIRIRKKLYSKGYRYRVNRAPIPGLRRRADIAFLGAHVAVFIDGCFWHGCPIHGTQAKQNAKFWSEKIGTNKKRDLDTNKRFMASGWEVLRICEHEDPVEATQKIIDMVESRRN